MLNVQTNDEIEQYEEEERQASLEERQNASPVIEIVSYIHKCWDAAKTAKQPVERQMLKNLRRKTGEYDPDKLAAIREQGGSELFMMLTEEKCAAAESWIEDILLPADEDPFGVDPSPRPDLSPGKIDEMKQQIQQEAEQFAMQNAGDMPPMEVFIARARELISDFENDVIREAKKHAQEAEKDLRDVAVEANWREALQDAIPDLVLYPCGFIKGPIARMAKEFVWDEQGQPTVEVIKKIEFESPSAWDIFPSPTSKRVGDGYLIERMQFTRADLYSLIGVQGYDEEAIKVVLAEFGGGAMKNWLNLANDTQRAQLEGREHEDWDPEGKIDALQFWGNIQGLALLEYGMPRESVDDPFGEYFCEAILIGSYVIKVELNGDPLGRPPYYKAGFRRKKGSFWETAMVDLMIDCQDMCNASARNLANNMAIACLTGDTEVYRHSMHGKKGDVITLNELWDKKFLHNSGLRRIKIRSLNEETGEFFLNRIQNIYDNGVADVYEVKTKHGYTIKATVNHRFMASSGDWQHLERFVVGDEIAVNGAKRLPDVVCIDCGEPLTRPTAKRCRKCASSSSVNKWNRLQIVKARENAETRDATARQRKECRDALRDHCEICGATANILEVHHKDRNPYNNSKKNLITLCDACHKYEHKRNDNLGNPYKHKYVDYDEIVSIKYVSTERVFDLEMQGPNHNFIANGFVSHNSGPQVGVDASKIPPGEDVTKIIPWKIWQFQMGNIQTNQQPIWFFQPQALVNELMAVYEKFSTEADNKTGIPKYSYGGSAESSAGAMDTATGMSMMMSNAARSIKKVVSNIDNGLIAPSIQRLAEWMMLYFQTKALLAGDIKIQAKGSSAMIAKEQQQVRRNEFLQVALHPTVTQIIGLNGVAEILRRILQGLDIDSDDVVPEKDELARMMQQAQNDKAEQDEQKQIEGPRQGREIEAGGAVQGGADVRTMG